MLDKTSRYVLLCILIFSSLILVNCKHNPTKESAQNQLDYNFHIRPILADKCYVCHGPDVGSREAGLRLDIADSAYTELKENPGHFAIVPGDIESSEIFHRITSQDPDVVMPPPESNLSLTPEEIAVLSDWISEGAVYKKHWAFIPPAKSVIPKTRNNNWAQNDLDPFILSKMEEMGLSPNPEASKFELLKRLSLDITGMPPSIELQEKYLNNEDPEAYQNLIDTLLSSKHYGEKMAIHWLDIARYADSHGYQDDGLRTMWPYRDWVIHAFNENYSYDKFLTWQLAGDLIPSANKEQMLASGFNRNHKITQEGGVIDEEYRIEYVTDRTNTFGKAFLGMTFECAKCHDHKYDPLSQEEYFKSFAFFNNVPEKGLFGDISKASLADPPFMEISDEDVENILSFINKKDTLPLHVMVMKDSIGLRETHLLKRGEYDQKAKVLTAGTPKSILPFDPEKFSSDRIGLSEWLLDPENPLTARVFVNRIWQEIFGKGLVASSGDFGMQGSLPSHPELLDYLAVDFMENGWDIKRLVKKLVSTACYKQSSTTDPLKTSIDPNNTYLSVMPRNRLNAETIRDLVLASSGLINAEIGGPSVKPYQPDGLWDAATSGRGVLKNYQQDSGDDLYRRGMYTFIKRTVPPPVMLMFDASSRDQCQVLRQQTNTPLQALVMMNDPTVLEASRVLASRLLKSGMKTERLLSVSFQKILCRKAEKKERNILLKHFTEEYDHFKQYPDEAKAFIAIGEYPLENNIEIPLLAASMQMIHTIYNMEESITKS